MSPYQNLRVLVVDDKELIRNETRGILVALGVPAENITLTSNAVKAQAILRIRPPYDLMITDFAMPPYMDGLQLIQEVRQNPQWNAMKIILASAHDLQAQALRAGAQGFAHKADLDEPRKEIERVVALPPPPVRAAAPLSPAVA